MNRYTYSAERYKYGDRAPILVTVFEDEDVAAVSKARNLVGKDYERLRLVSIEECPNGNQLNHSNP